MSLSRRPARPPATSARSSWPIAGRRIAGRCIAGELVTEHSAQRAGARSTAPAAGRTATAAALASSARPRARRSVSRPRRRPALQDRGDQLAERAGEVQLGIEIVGVDHANARRVRRTAPVTFAPSHIMGSGDGQMPPRGQQQKLVARVGQLMQICDELECHVRRAENRAAKLVDAIVQVLVA